MSPSRLLAAALAVSLAAPALAIPASPNPITLRNADGTTVQARMFGDEHLSWLEDTDGYSLAFDRQQGAWCYARHDGGGRLVPLAARAGSVLPSALGLTAHLAPGAAVREQARLMRRMVPAAPPAPRSGDVQNLVLLVRFSNETPQFTAADFEALFNGATGSVQDFYREISYGKVRLVSTVVDWIPLPGENSYYAYNDQRPDGHPEEMVRDAVAWLEQQGFDFAPFDADHDGLIDAVDVVHSGFGYEYTGDAAHIHSHFSSLRATTGVVTTASGIAFDAYHTEPEFGPDGRRITMLGVICHETAHFFGVPDLYDYGYDSSGLGWWSLMAAGSWAGRRNDGTSPSHPDAWTRMRLGYVEPQLIGETLDNIVLTPAEDGAVALKVAGAMPRQQYFLLENRQRRGYDAQLPGDGLLIYHVDEKQLTNNNQDHYLVDLEQADGRRDLNLSSGEDGDDGDPFPFAGNDAFTPDSHPSSRSYGNANSKVFVLRITREGSDVRFHVVLGDPTPVGSACAADVECWTGYCVDGICCNQACGTNGCSTCAVARGARVAGECAPLTGTTCDDGNPCTDGDLCQSGRCRGAARACAPNPCQTGVTCVRATGECTGVPVADGQACTDGDACTRRDACAAGTCVGGQPVDCAGECRAGSCDGATGNCVPVADGTSCAGGSCQAGECAAAGGGGLPGECACATAGAGGGWAALLLSGLARARRRR